jgi:hypothetical protein
MLKNPTIVLTSGAAPYLGGQQTWKLLRDAAPEFEFVEIDPLTFAGNADSEAIYEGALLDAVGKADGVVAHAGAARLVVEVVARLRPEMPVLLLSPILIQRTSVRLRIIRRIFGWRPVGHLITRFARAKYRRLCDNRDEVLKQLRLFVGESALSEALVSEAEARISDPRVERSIDRTVEFLRYATTPVNPIADNAVQNRRVIVGVGPIDRRIARRMTATVLHGVTGAAMIEEPTVVAEALRAMIQPKRCTNGSGSP